MELSVQEERKLQERDEVRTAAVESAIFHLASHLQSTACACLDLAYRLKCGNVAMTSRSKGTEAACIEMEHYPIDYKQEVEVVLNEMGIELTDDEPVIDSVKQEVERRIQGLVLLMGAA